MKKFWLCMVLYAQMLLSCSIIGGDGDVVIQTKTGRVTFFNESSYRVKVHRDAFSGPVEAELSAGQSKTADIRVSDSHYGTTFSIEYLYRIGDAFDANSADSGDVFASMLDFNVQINFVIEEGRSYTKQIPQPTNLEPRSSFIEVHNQYNLPCEVRDYGRILRQAGNGNIPIAPGKTGVYKLEGTPAAGELYQGYTAVSTFASAPFPDFTVQNGYIYRFAYSGGAVTQTGAQSIVFH
jgi:hypothetical protein